MEVLSFEIMVKEPGACALISAALNKPQDTGEHHVINEDPIQPRALAPGPPACSLWAPGSRDEARRPGALAPIVEGPLTPRIGPWACPR